MIANLVCASKIYSNMILVKYLFLSNHFLVDA